MVHFFYQQCYCTYTCLVSYIITRSLPLLHQLMQNSETVWHMITSSVNIWWVIYKYSMQDPSLTYSLMGGGGGGGGGRGVNNSLMLLIIDFIVIFLTGRGAELEGSTAWLH